MQHLKNHHISNDYIRHMKLGIVSNGTAVSGISTHQDIQAYVEMLLKPSQQAACDMATD